jgi:ATP-dependent RNA helicase RhlE
VSFNGLGLSPELLRAVADQGYETPTPVQSAAIPLVLEGRDLLAGAQTGTGKTAAFVLPIIHRLHETRRDAGAARHQVRVLVVVPTRELAIQVEESVRTYGAHRPIRSATIYGGVGFGPQVSKLRAGPEIVVATPGRLLDHLGQGTINLSSVEVLVLDEADRMLDMGFIRDIRKILAVLPPKRQNLLFSATFSDDISQLADGLLTNPAHVQVTPRNTTTELIDQLVIPVDRERKRDLLRELVALGRVKQALVFTRTKHGANRLAEQLRRDGIEAAAIHGNRSQSQRVKALSDFKEGRVAILVATDIAARGLDIEQLPHVVNFELPMVPEDYVHRIGRTGRAGIDGQAISLVCVDEAPLLRAIQGLLKRVITSETIAGFEPDRHIRPEPIRLRSTPAERAERAAALRQSGPARQAGPARHAGAAREETAAISARGMSAAHAGGHGGGRGPGRGAPQGDRRGRPAGDRPQETRRREESFVARPARSGADASRGHGAPGARPGGGPRRSGRGQGTATPGTGFGNASSVQRPGAHERSGQPHARSGGHGRPAAGHGRPAAGHGTQGQPRALPGERLSRAGGQGS